MSLNQENTLTLTNKNSMPLPITQLTAQPRSFATSRKMNLQSPTIRLLAEQDKNETLAFLNQRPVHTINMMGLIRDNGMESTANRGSFYGYHNEYGTLEGVALIGHATLVETRTDRAMETFARLAQDCLKKHVIFGEQERMQEFWNYYSEDSQPMRLLCQEQLFELKNTASLYDPIPNLRLASPDELSLIVPVQAQGVFEECGINPLDVDPEGFRQRCLRRIEQGKSWVLVEDGRLVFRTEVMAMTPKVTYLEGVWVNPNERGKGYGIRCLSQLCRNLSAQTASFCLLVNETNKEVTTFYQKVGFEFQSVYQTIYLQRNSNIAH